MKNKLLIGVLVLFLFVAMAPTVFAVSWWPLVPCGTSVNPTPCNQCELLHLFRNIIDFVLIGLMPPVATILFVWGGFLVLMGGANPGLISKGKTIFWNTVIGIAIISASWLITNTIIRSIAADNVAPEWWKFQCSVTTAGPPQPPAGGALTIATTSLPNAIQGTAYFQSLSATGGTAPYTWSLASGAIYLPPGLSVSGSTISGTPTATGTYTFTIAVADSSSPVKSATKQLNIVVGGTGTSALSITTSSLPDGTLNQAYSQTVTATGGTGTYSWSVSNGTLPAGLSINFANGKISGTPTIAGTSTFTVKVTDNSSPQQSATKQLSIVVGGTGTLTCGQSWEQNLCQARSMTCSASSCSQYVTAINQYAGGAASANFLKAVMIKESACNISADSGHAYGLMQLVPSTANIYKSRCGVPANVSIDSAWLTNSLNANASICIAAEYIRALSATSCGNTPRNIAAGYNGGSGACADSVSCVGKTSCDGSAVKKWECLYDDTANTVCNTGYTETRDYATKVLYCYNNPGF